MSDQQQVMSGDPISTPIQAPTPKAEPTQEPQAPLFTGIGGPINTQEELIKYAKNLEDMSISQRLQLDQKVREAIPAPPPFTTTQMQPAVDEEMQIEKDLQDVWFSDPAKAMNLIDRRNDLRREKKESVEKQKTDFWNEFYQKNPDLTKVKDTVQLIVTGRAHEVSQLKTKDETERFLATEARKIVDTMKNVFGTRETELNSKAAVSFGSSGEPIVAPPMPNVNQPKSLADQVLQLNRIRRQKK